jgi:hypothetical protein
MYTLEIKNTTTGVVTLVVFDYSPTPDQITAALETIGGRPPRK